MFLRVPDSYRDGSVVQRTATKFRMPLNIIIFGQIADITGVNNIALENVADTNQLIKQLNLAYPTLASAKYAIAVDKKIIKENTPLHKNNTIALLPPFSGG
ncbi:MAG: MoaD/ThiS family protein [Segetibacter sp.]